MMASRNLETFDSLNIETRAKRHIANEFGKPQLPMESMDAFYESMRRLWPDLERRSADSTYNCFGMVFAGRRTAVDEEALPIVFQDDGYRIVRRAEARPGDVVVYRDGGGEIAHVGVVLWRRIVTSEDEDELIVLSQWGFNGEYVHTVSQLPEVYGTVSNIWSERRI